VLDQHDVEALGDFLEDVTADERAVLGHAMRTEVLQTFLFLFVQVEGCHLKPRRGLQLVGVNRPETSVSGEVEYP
jgi:hypothetical protein